MLLCDIASARGVRQNFLAKIFHELTRYGIVCSFRRAGRGYDDLKERRVEFIKHYYLEDF